jgi:hypothetical protein
MIVKDVVMVKKINDDYGGWADPSDLVSCASLPV